jgi:FkbM family methyltransferase
MQDHLRSFLRQHPRLHMTARRVRRLVRPAPPPRPAPKVRRYELHLPQAPDREGGAGPGGDTAAPDVITVPPPGNHHLLKRLLREGIGGYEPETAACFLAALRRAPDGAVLDVGANVGLYSILASGRSDRAVYGFEPTPDLADLMRRISEANDLGFQTEQIALGSENGTATLYLSNQTDMSNSLTEGFRESRSQVDVPIERLDSWCERENVSPGLIKIDTETTEPAVIEGGLETIRRLRPWVFCEILHGRQVEDPVMKLMRPLGYTWYHLAGDPPYEPLDEIVGDRDFQHLMWIFTPAPVDPEFWTEVSAWRAGLERTCIPVEPVA